MEYPRKLTLEAVIEKLKRKNIRRSPFYNCLPNTVHTESIYINYMPKVLMHYFTVFFFLVDFQNWIASNKPTQIFDI